MYKVHRLLTLDIEVQSDIATLSKADTLKWMSCYKHTFQIAKYLNTKMSKPPGMMVGYLLDQNLTI